MSIYADIDNKPIYEFAQRVPIHQRSKQSKHFY